MRQIATLTDEEAHKFADYLLTQKIDTRLEKESAGVALWVCDEDKIDRARQELADFQRNPGDPRYTRAVSAARALRQEEARVEEDYNRRQHELEEEMDEAAGSPTGERPLTVALITVSVLITLAANFSDNSPVVRALAIASYQVSDRTIRFMPDLLEAREGQVWRLVTPIFLHFSVMHLAFNMFMLFSLGGRIESARGTLRLLLLVLGIGVASNLAEYYLRWSTASLSLVWEQSPRFGGMSGVLYGLFGYLWMKSRFEPELGLEMPADLFLIMLGWLVICLTGLIPEVANVAHVAGLLAGMALGFAFRRFRRHPAGDATSPPGGNP